MGIRLRHSIQLFPGFRINLSGSGLSATVGIPGANINFSSRGTRTTVGIPGSGLSYVHHQGFSPSDRLVSPSASSSTPIYSQTSQANPYETREIRSGAVTSLTSDSMLDFKKSLQQLSNQRAGLKKEIKDIQPKLDKLSKKIRRRKRSIFRYFFKKGNTKLGNQIYWLTSDITSARRLLNSSVIPLDFELDPVSQGLFGKLVRNFAELTKCSSIWDLVADRGVDRFHERSRATSAVTRKPVKFSFEKLEVFDCNSDALKLQNANGEDLFFMPAFLFMPRQDKEFAVVDLREINMQFSMTAFREQDTIPPDGLVIGQAWAKENRDGSRDLRFKGNTQIPVCKYGEITLKTAAGLYETYLFSSYELAKNFHASFIEFQTSLPKLTPIS